MKDAWTVRLHAHPRLARNMLPPTRGMKRNKKSGSGCLSRTAKWDNSRPLRSSHSTLAMAPSPGSLKRFTTTRRTEPCSPMAYRKYLAQQLGAARDWDVFITQILSEPTKVLQSDTLDFDALRQVAEAHRVTAYATLQEM